MEEQRIILERKEKYERQLQIEQLAIQSLLQSPPLNQYNQYNQYNQEYQEFQDFTYDYDYQQRFEIQDQKQVGKQEQNKYQDFPIDSNIYDSTLSPLSPPISSPPQQNSFATITKVSQFFILLII